MEMYGDLKVWRISMLILGLRGYNNSTVMIPAANQATALPENVGSSASLKVVAALLDLNVTKQQVD